jgi:hypothetical protein
MLFRVMLIVWIAVLFVSFLPSVIMGSLIQTRVARQDGWRALREKPFLETYWKNLTLLERSLLWPGIIMFFLTLFAATAWKLIESGH